MLRRFVLFTGLALSSISLAGAQDLASGDAFWDDRFTLHGVSRGPWPAQVFAMAVGPHGDVYVGGRFTEADTVAANRIARWDGRRWHALGAGLAGPEHGYVAAITVAEDGDVYVGGGFRQAGPVPARSITRWDGTRWHALGSGLDGEVRALAVRGGEIFAGGSLSVRIDDPDGAADAHNVARWDAASQAWSALGAGPANGVDYPGVDAIAAADAYVYVGGGFSTAGGEPIPHLARWDGIRWMSLGEGPDGPVFALAVDGRGHLYAGGAFTAAGGLPAAHIARWDGARWHALGAGVDGEVRTLALDGTDLYVGGLFTTAGGEAARGIARWDAAAEAWHDLSEGLVQAGGADFAVYDIAVNDAGHVYAVGGYFGPDSAPYDNVVAGYNGTRWTALGSGVGGDPFAVAARGGDVYVGGRFVSAGPHLAYNFARWEGAVSLPVEAREPLPRRFALDRNHPNPFSQATALTFTLAGPQAHVALEVFDVLGRRVAVLAEGTRAAGTHRVTWEAGGLPSGVYFCRLTVGRFVETQRMVLRK